MSLHRLQRQRFELKFHLRVEQVPVVREFLRGFLVLDEFGAMLPGGIYPVHSLYLDSADLRLCQATVNGEKNRYKLRLRYYDDDPEQPIYFEIKSRQNDCIFKQRAGVRRAAVEELIDGAWPEPRHLATPDAHQLAALQKFCRHQFELGARPRAHVAYQREAWVSPTSDALRVTFDSEVRCDTETTARLSTQMESEVSVFGETVILEVKFTDRFPDWIGEMAQALGLMRAGAAKYVQGLSLSGAAGQCGRADFALNYL